MCGQARSPGNLTRVNRELVVRCKHDFAIAMANAYLHAPPARCRNRELEFAAFFREKSPQIPLSCTVGRWFRLGGVGAKTQRILFLAFSRNKEGVLTYMDEFTSTV